MPDHPCPHHATARLDELRSWAWERGRTDVVWDLDLHDAAWRFRTARDRCHLARLSELLAPRPARDPLEAVILRAAAGDPDDRALQELGGAVTPWCLQLCRAVAADLAEVTDGPLEQPR